MTNNHLAFKGSEGVAVETTKYESALHMPEGEANADQLESEDGYKRDFPYNLEVIEESKPKENITEYSAENSTRTIRNPEHKTIKTNVEILRTNRSLDLPRGHHRDKLLF